MNMPSISQNETTTHDTQPADTVEATLGELVRLTRAIGRPERDFVVLAEGNTSTRLDDGTFLVKASGSRMAEVDRESFVRVELDPLIAAVAGDDQRNPAEVFRAANPTPAGRLPSIETFLHAVALAHAGARWVIHTHPTAVTGLLCAANGKDVLLGGPVFPDEAVVCGPRPAWVEYAEPGIELARAFAAELGSHVRRYRETPKVVYLGNHGLVALGSSAVEAEAVTAMAVKAARVRLIALAAGGPLYLARAGIEAMINRPDEVARRALLIADDSTTEEA
jgi:rhamnose utilization protein RhaD (predicted bifunctional aldolase and dehydrogenase)